MTLQMTGSDSIDHLARYQKLRRLWIFILLLAVGGILLMMRSAWTIEPVSEHIELAGLGLIWVGIIGRLWSILYIGGHKSSAIVTDGPYSVMRNPLYFFSTIAAIGVGLQTAMLTAGAVLGVLCFVAFHVVIRREEKFLAQAFGDPYRAYMRSVPRFFPKISLFHDLETREISTKRMYSTLFDGLVFFIAFPLFELAEYLQEIGVIPVLAYLY
jgi:protein-S-isoprenylcysteine O-methyltransferase Ste14